MNSFHLYTFSLVIFFFAILFILFTVLQINIFIFFQHLLVLLIGVLCVKVLSVDNGSFSDFKISGVLDTL